jgi:trigger factor
MDINKEQIDELNTQVKIQLTEEDLNPKVEASLTDIRKKANLKGFRPGKVPMGLIKKMYGKAVVYEEVNKMVSETLTNYLSDEKLEIIGEPIPSENQDTIDFDTQKEFNFSFDLGLRPEFEVKLNKKMKFPFYDIKIDDELIDKYVDSHADRHGKLESIDNVTENSFIKGEIVQLDAEGNIVIEGLQKEESSISISHIKDEETKKSFLDAKKGDALKIDVTKTFSGESEIAMVLGIDKEAVAEIEPHFQYTIREITEFIKAEVNEELYEKVFPEQEVKTEEDFRNKIKEEIKNATVKDSDYKFLLDARDKLIDKTEIPLPEDFLSRWLKLKDENKEVDEEKFNEDFPKFLRDLKWQLILGKMVKENDIKVEPEEVKELAVELTEMQFQQYYGVPAGSFPKEQMEQYAAEMFLKKEDEVRKLYDKKYEDKVVQIIKESVKLDNKEVTTEEFNKMLSGEKQ